jgi:hypothetical protein
MHVTVESVSYYALRRTPGAETWWNAVACGADVPAAVRALIAGRMRVEVDALDAADALTWAERVGGWPSSTRSPLVVHPSDPRV